MRNCCAAEDLLIFPHLSHNVDFPASFLRLILFLFKNPHFVCCHLLLLLRTDGGFAAAHAYISRHSTDSDPDSDPLTPSSVLVNYDPLESQLAKLERTKNASKADRIQDFLDNSSTEHCDHSDQVELSTYMSLSLQLSFGQRHEPGVLT